MMPKVRGIDLGGMLGAALASKLMDDDDDDQACRPRAQTQAIAGRAFVQHMTETKFASGQQIIPIKGVTGFTDHSVDSHAFIYVRPLDRNDAADLAIIRSSVATKKIDVPDCMVMLLGCNDDSPVFYADNASHFREMNAEELAAFHEALNAPEPETPPSADQTKSDQPTAA